MSEGKASFGLELIDKVSGSAEKIVGGLDGARGALEKLSGSSDRASAGMTKVGRATEYMTFALRGIQIAHGVLELSKMLGGFDKLKGGIKSAGVAVRRFGIWAAQGLKRVAPFAAGGAGLYGLGKIASTVAIPAMGATAAGIGAVGLAAGGATLAVGYLGLKLAGLAYDGIKATAEFATFGQNSRMAFGALAKYGASGAKLFQHTIDLAQELGQDVMDTTGSFKRLLAGGFNPRLATDVVKMGADMRFLGSSAEEVKGAVRAITQIKAAGRLQGDELNQLAEAGIGASSVYEALGKRLGKTVPQVMKLKEAGKIDSGTAIAAILEAVKKTTGEKELGEVGKRWADSSIDGMTAKLKARGQGMMVQLGDRLAPSLSRLASSALNWTENFVVSGRAELMLGRIGDTFDSVGEVLDRVTPLAGKFFDGFSSEASSGFGSFAKAVTSMNGADTAALGTNFEKMGKGLAQVAEVGALAAAGFGLLTAAATGLGKVVYEVVLGIPYKMIGVGVDIALGLARGIKSGVVYVTTAIEEMGASAVGRIKGFLDIRSPSRVLAGVGAMTAAGFALGISSNAGLAADAGRLMGMGAVQASEVSSAGALAAGAISAPAAPGSFGFGGLARGGTFRFQLTQHIDGSGLDANEVATISARESLRAVDDYFRAFDNEA